jgi:hypothetical protein
MMNGLLRIVFRLARMLGAGTAGALIVAVLPACGGGGTTSSPAPAPTATPLPGVKFYLPLAVGNSWTYNCAGGGSITDSIPAAQPVGSIEAFRFVIQFPGGSSQTQLLANNSDGSTTLYGYIAQDGTGVFVVPSVIIALNPTPGQQFNYPGQNSGTFVTRSFVGSGTSQTPLGTFNVATYSESSGADTYSYALGTGIAEQKHGSSDCLLAAIHLH